VKYKFYVVLIFIITTGWLQVIASTVKNNEVLAGIEIVGNQKQSIEMIRSRTGLKEGDDLSRIDLTEVLNKLWATNLYDDIKIEVISDDVGKKILFRVQERPIIKKVIYIGGKKIGINVIKEKIKENKLDININSTYSPESIRKIKNLIVDLALNVGFASPTINVNIEQVSPTASQIVFDIKEGSRTKFQHIILQGNSAIDKTILKSVMNKTHKSLLTRLTRSDNILIKNEIDEDIENIKYEYWKRGYKDVSVGEPIIHPTTFLTEKQKNIGAKRDHKQRVQNATITIPIIEGERFNKGTLKIHGDDKILNMERIESLYQKEPTKSKEGSRIWSMYIPKSKRFVGSDAYRHLESFNLYAVNKIIEDITTNYNNNGYINCNVQKELKVTDSPNGNTVDVTLNINNGEQFKVNRISFKGNAKTKDKILRRSIMIDEGDVFSINKLKDSVSQLSQIGYFNIKQNPKCELVANASNVDVTISGEESGTNTVMFKGGYGSSHGFSVGGSIFTDNLNGNGQSLGISLDTSKANRVLSIDYTEPFLFDTPYSVTTSVFSESINPRAYKGYKGGIKDTGRRRNYGVGISGQTKLSTYLPNYNWAYFTSCSAGYKFHITRVDDVDSCYFCRDDRWKLTSSLNQSFTYSTINHPFQPTVGQSIKVKLEYGGWQFNKDIQFFKTSLDYKKLIEITRRSTFYFYTNCGYVKTQKSDNENHNVLNLFRTGGENSIRGFAENNVGPTAIDCNGERIFIGGNRQFVVNLEYQFRLTNVVQLILFHDSGQAWAKGTSVYRQRPCSSVGAEIRLFTPISPAPIRFIWSRKINQYSFDKSPRLDFQFTIGTTI